MKKAQIVVEYAILSAFVITVVVAAVVVLNIRQIGVGTTFGFGSEGQTVTVPPMTP